MALVKVAETASLAPGRGMYVEAEGKELALFNVEGQYYCIDNECPHSLGPLADGYLEGDIVICPWHAWEFSVRTGKSPSIPGCSVGSYACIVQDSAVWIDL